MWEKKNEADFDVTIGSFSGGEVADMVGLYLLNRMKEIVAIDSYGLYKDDGLCALKGNGRQIDCVRKKLIALFQNEGLGITTEANLRVVDYLDVVLNLEDKTYKPFVKPNSSTKYVSVESNHPPCVLKSIPMGICKRLSSVSSNKEKFMEEAPYYQQALEEAGYDDKLEYIEDSVPREPGQEKCRKKRTRNVIWFNPPFSANVKTNIGRLFFNLLAKHFPSSSRFYKLFNPKNVKLSYSCCPNMKAMISRHNTKMIQSEGSGGNDERSCNCRGGVGSCPFGGKCLMKNLIYRGTVTSNEGVKEYIGQTMTTFKKRYTKHKSDFNLVKNRHATSLSTYVWQLKDKGVAHDVKYSLVRRGKPYWRGDRTCNLCLKEKTDIAIHSNESTCLNKRAEILTKCRHLEPHTLDNFG